MKTTWSVVGLCLLLCGCNTEPSSTANVDRDNTEVNERDADGTSVTPMDQSNETADINQVAEIRAAVLEIDDLSTNGRNVKIITDQGKVVLRGPVDSDAERQAIAKVAERIAGAGNVNNLLEVEN